MVKYLEKEEDFEKIIQNKVLVDFYADWCGPCQRLGEVIEDIDFIDILKVNVDKFSDIARSYGIMSIPTLILFKEGVAKQTEVGYRSLDEIKEMVK